MVGVKQTQRISTIKKQVKKMIMEIKQMGILTLGMQWKHDCVWKEHPHFKTKLPVGIMTRQTAIFTLMKDEDTEKQVC